MATFESAGFGLDGMASSWISDVAAFPCAWRLLPGVAFEKVVSRPLGLQEAMSICIREPCDALTRVEDGGPARVEEKHMHWRLMRGRPHQRDNVLSLGYSCHRPPHRRFDFVEAGTSDFGTLAQEVAIGNGTATVGLSVEPVLTHLASLPSGRKQHLVLAAIGAADSWATVHYLEPSMLPDPSEIRRLVDTLQQPWWSLGPLPWWLRGCSSMEQPHPSWADLPIPAAAYQTDIVPVYSMATLFRLHGVAAMDRFQIDVEGAEAMVLSQLLAAARSNPSLFPEEVRFAADDLSNVTDHFRFQRFRKRLTRAGYLCDIHVPGPHLDVLCRMDPGGFNGALYRLRRVQGDAGWFRRALWICHNCTIPEWAIEGLPILSSVMQARQQPHRRVLLDDVLVSVVSKAPRLALWLGVRSDTMELQMTWRHLSDALWVTADADPGVAQFGSSEHHCTMKLELLPAGCLPDESADVIFLDQAIVNHSGTDDALYSALSRTLSPAGILVLGRKCKNPSYCEIPSGFKPRVDTTSHYNISGATSGYIYDLLEKN